MHTVDNLQSVRVPSLALPVSHARRHDAGEDLLAPASDPLTRRLLAVEPLAGGFHRYDLDVASLLCTASTWAYSSLPAYAMALAMSGLEQNSTRVIAVENDALLVVARAYFTRSADGQVGILAFRGTEPANAINWLTDVNMKPVHLPPLGMVHGGFHTNLWALWNILERVLLLAVEGADQPDDIPMLDVGAPSSGEREPAPALPPGAPPPPPRLQPLRALFITGHSLGGAMAALAAANICFAPRLSAVQRVLRGVYTFGQPMVGDPRFAENCEKRLGPMVFRHVFANDIVPRMPPLLGGRFAHFGQELRAAEGGGWQTSDQPVRQMATAVLGNVLGAAAFLMQQIPLLAGLPMPLSWGAHLPLNYIHACRMSSFELGML